MFVTRETSQFGIAPYKVSEEHNPSMGWESKHSETPDAIVSSVNGHEYLQSHEESGPFHTTFAPASSIPLQLNLVWKAKASVKIPDCSLVAAAPVHIKIYWSNFDAPWNMRSIFVTFEVSHVPMSPLKERANLNIWYILVTLETFHADMLPLKFSLMAKTLCMFVTRPTSQSGIVPSFRLEPNLSHNP